MGSFLSIESGKSSEEEEKVHDTTMANKVKILKFEDTLADEDYRLFKIIYDSLLLEGQAGNITKTTLEVVLAQKPPAWLQEIYERLKHLMVSLKTFWKMKGKHIAKGKAKIPKKIKFKVNKRQERQLKAIRDEKLEKQRKMQRWMKALREIQKYQKGANLLI